MRIVSGVVLILVGGYIFYQRSQMKPVDMEISVNSTSTVMTPSSTEVVPSTTTVSAPETQATKSFTVNGSNYAFAPTSLTVNKGDKVSITFVNTGGLHDFKIDEFNVATRQLNGNEKQTVTFTADKVGSFEYYCSVGRHREMGMKGILTVK
jgi:plastocyanin